MKTNIDAVLKRGELIQDMEAQSQKIEIYAMLVALRKRQSRRFWLASLLIAGGVVGVVLLLLIFIAVVA